MKTMTGSYLAATEPTGPTGTAGTEKPAPAADASKPLRTLTVKSLKMIAGSCSEAVQQLEQFRRTCHLVQARLLPNA